MSKVSLLSERSPFSLVQKTKNLLYNYCKMLYERLGLDEISVLFMDNNDNIAVKPDYAIAYLVVRFVAKREGKIYDARLEEKKVVITPLRVDCKFFFLFLK